MPGGIILSERADADVVAPAAGKIRLFPRSAASDALSYMDSAGVIHQLLDTAVAGAGYQPLDSDLTAVAALATTAYGRSLLTLANLAALQAALAQSVAIPIVVDGAGIAITTGVKLDVTIPFACTITEWTILLDQSGSIVFDIWKDTYANYPPTIADTITAAAKPTVSGATKAQSSTLTGWTIAVAAGDTLRINVDSITSATRALLSLKATRL